MSAFWIGFLFGVPAGAILLVVIILALIALGPSIIK